jgi:hypothetical protein
VEKLRVAPVAPAVALATLAAWSLAAALHPAAARADVIASDDFESYPAGAQLEEGPNGSEGAGLAGGTGFAGPYNVIDNNLKTNVTVQQQSLQYTSGSLIVSGGARASLMSDAANGTANGLYTRPVPAQNDTVYLGFLFRTNNPSASSEDFIQVGISDVPTGEPKASVGINNNAAGNAPPPRFFARVPAGTAGHSQAADIATEETTFLVVGKFSKTAGSSTYNRVDLFLNPSSAEEPAAPTAFREAAVGQGATSITNFIVRTARLEAGDQYFIDNLVIGTTFADAVVPEPTSAGVLGAAAAGLLLRRRRGGRAARR